MLSNIIAAALSIAAMATAPAAIAPTAPSIEDLHCVSYVQASAELGRCAYERGELVEVTATGPITSLSVRLADGRIATAASADAYATMTAQAHPAN